VIANENGGGFNMDRPDERRRVDADTIDRTERIERVEDDVAREGDVLGLGGASVPKMPGDPTASNDPESVARRRERAMADDERGVGREDPYRQSPGATGIDMGSGGRGTDVSGE
jgi:hypothetical protein